MNKEIYSKYVKLYTPAFLYIGLGLVVFVLSINFSKDWARYQFYNQFYINRYPHMEFMEIINPLHEPLYKWISIKVSGLFGFSGFVFIATVSLLYLKLRYLEKILGNAYIGTFFYVCIYLLLFEGTAIRIAYATALIIPAFYYLKIDRYILAGLLIFTASLIHFTALIFLVVFPLYFFRWSKILIYLLLLSGVLVLMLDISIFEYLKGILGAINPRYLDYDNVDIKLAAQNSTGLYFYFVAFYSTLLIAIYRYIDNRINKDAFSRAIFLLTILAVALMCLFHDHVAAGARLGELLLLPIVILLAWMDDYFHSNGMQTHRLILFLIFLGYFVARLVYLYPTIFRIQIGV